MLCRMCNTLFECGEPSQLQQEPPGIIRELGSEAIEVFGIDLHQQ